jgi:hypothetical protein
VYPHHRNNMIIIKEENNQPFLMIPQMEESMRERAL